MDYTQMFLYGIIIITALSIVRSYSLKDKIYCTYRRRDKTKIHKWAKAVNGYRIQFENGWYYVNIRRCVLEFKWVGILPIWIRTLDFRFDSTQALDPETFNNNWETPEARKALNKEEDIKALDTGTKKSLSPGKGGALGSGWMPYIIVGGFVVVGWFLYQLMGKVDALGFAVNVLQQMMP